MPTSRLRSLRRKSGASQRWLGVALAVFLIVDAALVAWALTAGTGSAVPAAIAVSASPSTHLGSVESGTTQATTLPTNSSDADVAPPSRTLTAVDGDVAWRATTTACPGGTTTIEVTDDGGASWSSSDIGAYTDAQSILRIVAGSASEATAVTLQGEGCDAGVAGTYVGGEEWQAYPDRLAGYWFLSPFDKATVVTSVGSVKAPCEVAVVAPGDNQDGAVLCSNHSIRITNDAGGSWSREIRIAGAANIAFASSSYIVAVVGAPECDGVSIVSVDDQSASRPTGCLEEVPEHGEIAVDAAGGTIWLWFGDVLKRSTDGGKSWS